MGSAKQKGIYLRGKIYWIRYAGVDGRIIRESTGSTKKEAAKRLLRSRKVAIDEGNSPETGMRKQNLPFSELCERYDTWVKQQACYRTKKYYIRQLRGIFGDVRIKDITLEMMEFLQTIMQGIMPKKWPSEFAFIRDRRKKYFKLDAYSPSHINRVRSCFKHMMTKGADWDFGKDLPKRFSKLKKLIENERTENYSLETCRRLIASAKTVHHRIYVLIGLNAGCRNCEAMHLKWGDIDLVGKTISFQPAYTKNKKLRVVPLNPTLHSALQAWFDQMPKKPEPGDWLFRNAETGERIASFRKAFATMCKSVGIECRYHALRHTFASKLAAQKVHVKLIAELIGDSVETSALHPS